jgi:hypothetical protein
VRQCRRGAHRSTSGGGEVARRRWKTHVAQALERGGELESKGRRCGGSQGSSRVHIEGRGTAVEG